MKARPNQFGRLSQLLTMIWGVSQIQAACGYAPPPLPSQGQTAEALGTGNVALSAEVGAGAVASWWNASNLADVDQTNGWVSAGRMRIGLSENVDLGVVSALGPRGTWVAGPELKWRFSRVAPLGARGMPGFQAAWINGIGVGSAALRYDAGRCEEPISAPSPCMMIPDGEPWVHRPYAAPYTGILVSAGTDTTQLYTGARLAVSEVIDNRLFDLTIYPSLGFGGQLRPWRQLAFHAESNFGAALTASDFADSGLMVYFGTGVTVFLGSK